jgi:ABC-type phosphate/phosphonate transport system substrate-binding protein
MQGLKLAVLAGFFVGLVSSVPAFADMSIGVVAPRGEAQAQAEWSEFARYLESKLGEILVNKMVQAIADKRVDFALTDPVQAVSVSRTYGMPLVASLIPASGPQFGGVIIANPKTGITRIEDLKGKKVSALSTVSAGGYLFEAYEAMKHGLKVPQDLAQLLEVKNQDDTVFAVKAGVMDAGFIRTGQLENMVKDGKVAESDLVVVDRKGGFPLALSTALYPEWYLVGVTGDAAKAAKVKAAVVALGAESPAAKAAKIKGFSDPLDPAPIVEMMKAMKIAPFNQ